MDYVCVIEKGCINRTVESDVKVQLLSYLVSNLALFDAIYSTVEERAIKTSRVIERQTGHRYHSDVRLGEYLNPGFGWQRAQRGAVKWLCDKSQEHSSGVIAVMGELNMRELAGAALRETQGGPGVVAGIAQGWQERGSVAIVADIQAQRLIEPLLELSVELR